MTVPVEEVALRFQGRFGRPAGALNTLVYRDGQGAYLRVLVDPRYWQMISIDLPAEYEGYRVVKERRPDATAFH